MAGRPLDAVQRVPDELLNHLAAQIDVPAPMIETLRALYLKRRRTLFEHQRWVMDFLGLIRFELTDIPGILPTLCDVVGAGVTGDQLLTATRKCLYEKRLFIPGSRRLSNLVQAAVSAVEQEALAKIERDIPVNVRGYWLDALLRPAGFEGRMTLLEYLQEPPGRVSPSTIDRAGR